MREILNPSVVHRPVGLYSHAVKARFFVFVAGQLGLDGNGNVIGPGDIEVQTRAAFDNLKRVLEASGSDLDRIVLLNIYVTDMTAFQTKAREVRRDYFLREFPAITVVEVKGLARPEYMVEIEAVALTDEA